MYLPSMVSFNSPSFLLTITIILLFKGGSHAHIGQRKQRVGKQAEAVKKKTLGFFHKNGEERASTFSVLIVYFSGTINMVLLFLREQAYKYYMHFLNTNVFSLHVDMCNTPLNALMFNCVIKPSHLKCISFFTR